MYYSHNLKIENTTNCLKIENTTNCFFFKKSSCMHEKGSYVNKFVIFIKENKSCGIFEDN